MPHGAAEAEENIDEEAIWRKLRLVLEEAVRKWMVADVEVGSFLSGGLDSSITAAHGAGLSWWRNRSVVKGSATTSTPA